MPSDDRAKRTERELFMRSFGWPATAATASALRQLVSAMRESTFAPGSLLYEQGAIPRFVYFIMEGRVRLAAPDQQPWFFDRLSVVGGLDALKDIPHTRTAVAIQDSRCLMMPVERYFEILEDSDELMRGMMTTMLGAIQIDGAELPLEVLHAHEIADPSSLLMGAPVRKLSLLERLLVLRQAPLFGRLRSQMMVALAETIEEIQLDPGQEVVVGGQPSGALHLVATGSLEVERLSRNDRQTIGPGNVVAIFATLSDTDRDYRATARTPARVLRLLKVDVQDAFEEHPDMARVALAFAARERNRIRTLLANQKK